MAQPCEDPDPLLCTPQEKRVIDELCGDKLFGIYADKLLDQEEDGEVVEVDVKVDPPPVKTQEVFNEPPAGTSSNNLMAEQSGQPGSMPTLSGRSTPPSVPSRSFTPPPPAPGAVSEASGSGGSGDNASASPALPGSAGLVEQAVGIFKLLLEEDARNRNTAPDADKMLHDILAEYDEHKRAVIKRPTRMLLKFIRNDEYIWSQVIKNSMLFSSFLTLVDRELKEEPLAFIVNGEQVQRSRKRDRDQHRDQEDDREGRDQHRDQEDDREGRGQHHGHRNGRRDRDQYRERNDYDRRRSSRSTSSGRGRFRGHITPSYSYANNKNQGPVPIINHYIPYSTVAGGPAPLDVDTTRPPPPLPQSATGSRSGSATRTSSDPTPREVKEGDEQRRLEYRQQKEQQAQTHVTPAAGKHEDIGDDTKMRIIAEFLKYQNTVETETKKTPPVIDVEDDEGNQEDVRSEDQDSGGAWETFSSKRRKKQIEGGVRGSGCSPSA